MKKNIWLIVIVVIVIMSFTILKKTGNMYILTDNGIDYKATTNLDFSGGDGYSMSITTNPLQISSQVNQPNKQVSAIVRLVSMNMNISHNFDVIRVDTYVHLVASGTGPTSSYSLGITDGPHSVGISGVISDHSNSGKSAYFTFVQIKQDAGYFSVVDSAGNSASLPVSDFNKSAEWNLYIYSSSSAGGSGVAESSVTVSKITITECETGNDCEVCFAQCIDGKCIEGTPPPKPCSESIWLGYPYCTWDSSLCPQQTDDNTQVGDSTQDNQQQTTEPISSDYTFFEQSNSKFDWIIPLVIGIAIFMWFTIRKKHIKK